MTNAPAVSMGMYIPVIAGLIIGTISFVGSIVAWGKLNGKIGDFRFPSQQIINAVVLVAILGVAYLNYGEFNATQSSLYFYVTIGLAIVYGLLFVFSDLLSVSFVIVVLVFGCVLGGYSV